MRDGQVTKDFLESVHEILNEWHLIELVLRNVMVLNRINLLSWNLAQGGNYDRGYFASHLVNTLFVSSEKTDLSRFPSMKSLPAKERVRRPMSLPIKGTANNCTWMNVLLNLLW